MNYEGRLKCLTITINNSISFKYHAQVLLWLDNYHWFPPHQESASAEAATPDTKPAVDEAQPAKKKRGRKRKVPLEKPKDAEGGEKLKGEEGEVESGVTEQTVATEMNKKGSTGDENPPSSPSLPSSSSGSSDEEEDSASAISRIREKAADLLKNLKQQRIVATKQQTAKKQKTETTSASPATQEKKRGRPPKLEVKEEVPCIHMNCS